MGLLAVSAEVGERDRIPAGRCFLCAVHPCSCSQVGATSELYSSGDPEGTSFNVHFLWFGACFPLYLSCVLVLPSVVRALCCLASTCRPSPGECARAVTVRYDTISSLSPLPRPILASAPTPTTSRTTHTFPPSTLDSTYILCHIPPPTPNLATIYGTPRLRCDSLDPCLARR